ncbi:branched-chain amino acid ABC transporter permease [Spirochaetia bacterium]|nr:branched-chain amino acid ABC transporter permease [Spirochaetia bacterium]
MEVFVFLQQLIDGVSLGGVYALIALGYTMIYGVIMVINFAHGDLLMIGAYAACFILSALGLSPASVVLAFLFAMALGGILGTLIERLAFRPLWGAPRLNSLVVAVAVSMILQNAARVLPFMGSAPRQFPRPAEHLISFGIFSVSNIRLAVILVSAALMILFTVVMRCSKWGKAIRALTWDRSAYGLMGIPVNVVVSFTFALGSALAAAGGILYAFVHPQLSPAMGAMPGLKALAAAMLGGIGSVPGAMLGGLILGVAEALAGAFISPAYVEGIPFTILIIVLLISPSGLLGKNRRGGNINA